MDAIWHRSGSFGFFYLSSLWDNFKWNVNQNTKFPLKKIRYGHFVQAGVSLTPSENNAQDHTTIWTREMGGISFWDMDKVMTHRRNLEGCSYWYVHVNITTTVWRTNPHITVKWYQANGLSTNTFWVLNIRHFGQPNFTCMLMIYTLQVWIKRCSNGVNKGAHSKLCSQWLGCRPLFCYWSRWHLMKNGMYIWKY